MEPKSAAEYLELKFKEWQRGVSRQEGTVVGFAKHLGVNRDILNKWMNGNTKTKIGPKYAHLLASKLGPELYKYIKVPEPEIQEMIDRLKSASDGRRRQVAELLGEDEDRLRLLEIYDRLSAQSRESLVNYADLFLRAAGKEGDLEKPRKHPILDLIKKYWKFIPDELKAELPISDWSLFLDNELGQVMGGEAGPRNHDGN